MTQLATVFGSGRTTIDLDPTAFLVDRCDRVYVCGWGGSSNRSTGTAPINYLGLNGTTLGMPITPGAVQTTTDGNDFYLAQFTAGLTQLEYATYYGHIGGTGDHVDGGTARFDPRGVVYQAVCSCTGSTGFPILGGVNTFSLTNNSNNCNNAAFVLNFQPNIASAGTDQNVCATAATVPLVGTPAGGVWSGPGVSGSVQTGFFFTPSLALLGIQTLTYSVASTGLCSTTDTRRMIVGSPTPVTFAPVGTGLFCRAASSPAFGTVPLAGNPAGGTFGGPGVLGSVFDPNLAGPGTHTLTYTYTNGCVTVLSQQVQVSLISAGPGATLCAPGPPVPLPATTPGGVWTGPGVTGSVQTGFSFTPTVTLAGSNLLTYSTTTTSAAGTCTATSAAFYRVVSTPTISLTALPAQCVTTQVPVPLEASPAGGTWVGPGVRYNTTQGYYFIPGSVGVGTFQLTYSAGVVPCVASASLSVAVLGLPVATLPADTILCPGSTQPFRLRGTPAGGTWTGPGVSGSAASGFVFTPAAGLTGSVALTYSVGNGACTGTATRRVAVAPVPEGMASWAPEACPETRLAPLTLRFRLASTGNAPISGLTWEFGDGMQSAEASPVHTYATPGTYQPRLRLRYNQGRCETQLALAPAVVQERKVPNVITPNGDHLNETFQLGPDCPPRFQVYSRWGQQVFESAAYHDEWGAEGLPAGVYYYLLTYPDGHRVKGWVEVMR